MTAAKNSGQAKIIAAVRTYAKEISALRGGGKAREHAYRPALQNLLNALIPGAQAINEGERGKAGAPDFRVEWKNNAVLGHAETKDIGVDLDATAKSEQMARYLSAFSNLILTDYLEFRRYARGKFVESAKLADEIVGGKMRPPLSNQRALRLAEFLHAFAEAGKSGADESPSAEVLAKTLAAKAKEIKRAAAAALKNENADLISLHEAFSKNLIHGLKPEKFADIFAQTAVYALFTARLEADNRGKVKEFSRAVAGELLPQTTPFLRRFFNQFMQQDLDADLAAAADNTADYLRAASMETVRAEFAKRADTDPFMHFYETFLKHYDGDLRRKHGVYYTPPPVVDFIVRAANDCLAKYFPEEAPGGLADSSFAENPRKKRNKKKNGNPAETPAQHIVQILDPAAGTGAFLSKVVETIKEKIGRSGGWEDYAAEELLPRLFGFENMMSAYAICHIKFALDLGEKVMKRLQDNNERVKVYLTDSLDYGKHPPMGIGWLDAEARAADSVKSEKPVMVVLGNPPYNVKSENFSAHILDLLKDYKKDLGERKTNLDDDYIKFIRNAEWLVAEETGRGIVAFITNN
ncbi:MAG: N-6 DNA methylase, partial [Betaproteobacteria bacterium]|nr:N-6 DNA methylase [Betaproteobacteria bacterium]